MILSSTPSASGIRVWPEAPMEIRVDKVRKDFHWWEMRAHKFLTVFLSTSEEFDDREGTMELVEAEMLVSGKIEMGIGHET